MAGKKNSGEEFVEERLYQLRIWLDEGNSREDCHNNMSQWGLSRRSQMRYLARAERDQRLIASDWGRQAYTKLSKDLQAELALIIDDPEATRSEKIQAIKTLDGIARGETPVNQYDSRPAELTEVSDATILKLMKDAKDES